VQAYLNEDETGYNIRWDGVGGADRYFVYRSTSPGEDVDDYTALGSTEETSFDDIFDELYEDDYGVKAAKHRYISERSATVSATTSEELLRQEEQSPITEALLTLSIPESFSRVLEDGVRVEPLVVALTSSISDLSEAADISERHNIILQDIRSTDAIEIAASITQSEPLVKPAALVALIDGVSRAVTPAGTTEQAVSTSDIQALGESTTDGFLQSSSSTFLTIIIVYIWHVNIVCNKRVHSSCYRFVTITT
jgi:hypothetical protein